MLNKFNVKLMNVWVNTMRKEKTKRKTSNQMRKDGSRYLRSKFLVLNEWVLIFRKNSSKIIFCNFIGVEILVLLGNKVSKITLWRRSRRNEGEKNCWISILSKSENPKWIVRFIFICRTGVLKRIVVVLLITIFFFQF